MKAISQRTGVMSVCRQTKMVNLPSYRHAGHGNKIDWGMKFSLRGNTCLPNVKRIGAGKAERSRITLQAMEVR
jgi:hypothetical protein